MATELEKLIVRIEADLSKLKSGMREGVRVTKRGGDQMSKSFAGANKSVTSLTGNIKQLAAGLGILSAAAIAARSLTGAVRAFAQFDKELSGLAAVTGAAGKDLDFLRSSALRLGKDTTSSSAEVLRAFALIASAKPDLLSNVAALEEVTAAALTLSEATGESVPDSVRTLTTALNQFGAGAEEASRFINVLAAGAQKGAIEVGPFSQALTKAGTVAASAGVSFEEFTAVVQTLGTFGTPLEQIGTSLRNIFLKMQEGADDVNPTIVGLEQAVLNLDSQLGSTADQIKFFGLENQVVGQQLLEVITQAQNLRQEITGTNQAFDQAATRTDNLSQDLDDLGDAFTNLGIAITSQRAGPLRSVIQTFEEMVNAASDATGAIGLLEGAFASLARGEGPTFIEILERLHGVTPETMILGAPDASGSIPGLGRNVTGAGLFPPPAPPKPGRSAAGSSGSLPSAIKVEVPEIQGPGVPDANNLLNSLRMQTKELEIELALFGEQSSEIDRQLALLQARSSLFGEDLNTAEAEIEAQFKIVSAIEARTKAEEDLQRIKDVQIRSNAEIQSSMLNLTGAATAFAGSVTSAFEDAVVAGGDFSDMLDGLEEDFLRLLSRLLITEPFEKGLRTGLGAFEEPTGAGGPGGIEGLIGGGLTGLADRFGFGGPGTSKAIEKSIGSEIGGAGSEFISGEDAAAIFGDLTDQAGILGFAFEDAKSAAGRASAALGGDLVAETLLTTGVKATESSITISTTTAVGELGVAATSAAVAISSMTTAAAAGSAATAPGGPVGGALGLLGGFGGSFGGGGGGLDAQIAADVASGFGGIFHGGGVVGSTRVPARSVPAGTFSGAPRLHDGGIPGLAADEVPAILQRGETVIPRDGAGGNTFIFNGVTDFESFRRNRSQLRGIGHEMSGRAEAKDS